MLAAPALVARLFASNWLILGAVALIALLGAWLTWRALFADRARGRPRCPRCWYSMHLAPTLRCPECGTLAKDQRALLRTRRRWPLGLLGLVLLLGPGLAVGLTRYRQPILNFVLPRWWCVRSQVIAGYTVRLYQDRSTGWGRPMQLRISAQGTTYVTIEDQVVELGAADSSGQVRVGIGQDINGDGVPDLVVTQFSGGAHCCFSYSIVSLEPSAARVVGFVPAEDGGAAFVDLNGDGMVELRVQESAFRYWNTYFAASPAPEVILRWNGAAYALAPDLMAAPPIPEIELSRRASEVAETASRSVAASQAVLSNIPLLWRTMLELIYAGHPARAAAFLDQAWPPGVPGKEQFRTDFNRQLRTSRFWPALQLIEQFAHPAASRPAPE